MLLKLLKRVETMFNDIQETNTVSLLLDDLFIVKPIFRHLN